MACLDMYSSNQQTSSSSDHNKPPPPLPLPPISPRISFSNDFAESKHLHRHHKLNPSSSSSSFATPASSDFEFCVPTGNSPTMIGADELFFKGRLLPLKQGTTTLREELMVEDGDQGTRRLSHRPPLKGWKELLGLRNGSKKSAAKSKGNNHNNNNHQHDQEFSG